MCNTDDVRLERVPIRCANRHHRPCVLRVLDFLSGWTHSSGTVLGHCGHGVPRVLKLSLEFVRDGRVLVQRRHTMLELLIVRRGVHVFDAGLLACS